MKVITVASLKGGVGKTTVSIFLSIALAERGKRVLAIDMDPNNNLTDYFLRNTDPEEIERRNVYHLLSGKLPATACIYPGGVDVIPCTLSLHRVGIEQATNPGSLLRFASALRKLDYDMILMDTPPSPGYELRASLHASDLVLSPVGLSRWNVQALDILRGEILDVKEDVGRAPELLALPAMVTESEERSLRLSGVARLLTRTGIHRSSVLKHAAERGGLPSRTSRGNQDFKRLAEEVA